MKGGRHTRTQITPHVSLAVQNIVFKAKESKGLTASDADIEGLIQELLANHTIG